MSELIRHIACRGACYAIIQTTFTNCMIITRFPQKSKNRHTIAHSTQLSEFDADDLVSFNYALHTEPAKFYYFKLTVWYRYRTGHFSDTHDAVIFFFLFVSGIYSVRFQIETKNHKHCALERRIRSREANFPETSDGRLSS